VYICAVQRVIVSVRRRGDAQIAEFEVPTDLSASELAQQFAEILGAPTGATPLAIQVASLGRALAPNETLAEAGVWDGASLVLARVGDPNEVTAMVPLTSNRSRLLPAPAPPVLSLPPEERPRCSLTPLLGAAVVLLGLLVGGLFLLRPVAPPPPAAAPLQPPVQAAEPTAAPTERPTATLNLSLATRLPSSTPSGSDEQAAWTQLLHQLDQVWGSDWPSSISLLQAFHTQYPTRASATDKLYAAFVEYGRALQDAGATSDAAEQFQQAIRLAPQRREARDQLAALTPPPNEQPPAVAAPAPPQVVVVPSATPIPQPVAAALPPAPPPPPLETVTPACDTTSVDTACPLADGSQVQASIETPGGRGFYWFGIPSPDMRVQVRVDGAACPCALLVFADLVDETTTPVLSASGGQASATVLDQVIHAPGAYVLEVVPDQQGDPHSGGYGLAVALSVAPTPEPTSTPVAIVEQQPPLPTATPVPIPVPPVVAHAASDAADQVRTLGLLPQVATADLFSAGGPGTVAAQDPPAGTPLQPGSTVKLLVASGNVVVPAVVGMTEQDATTSLRQVGLEVTIRRARRLDVPAGRVADVNPGSGGVAAAGSNVLLTVSQG
jgi:hypothetical protein